MISQGVNLTSDLEGDVNLFYSKYYKKIIREGPIGGVQNFSHKLLERLFFKKSDFKNVLEVGVGAGDHFPFVKHSFGTYIQSDIRLNLLQEIPNNLDTAKIALDASKLPFGNSKIDRVIATCLILHLLQPEETLEEWRRVVKNNGLISILVPCEPGILLRIARVFTTNLKAKKLGYPNYILFNARDHINHLPGVNEIIKYVFRNDQIKVLKFPLAFLTWNFNLFYIYQIKVKKYE